VSDHLTDFVDRFGQVRVAVLGDFMLDEYVFGEISRVSREAPVLILKFQEARFRPGGAANTVANVSSLGATAVALGVLGHDSKGEQVRSLWPENVDQTHLVIDPNSETTKKTRILAGSFHSYQQQVVRLDYEHKLELTVETEERVLQGLQATISDLDSIIISDYSLGSLTPVLRKEVIDIGRKHGVPVVVDSRDNSSRFHGAAVVTPNISEVESALNTEIGTDLEKLEEVCFDLQNRWNLDALLVTRGKLGISLFHEEGALHLPAFGSEEAVDVSGAGDTVAAVFSTALGANASFEDAVRLANYAGGLVVMKKGTATVSPGELSQAVSSSR
jgi:rfaE bifunctional protein kinase chain/domain